MEQHALPAGVRDTTIAITDQLSPLDTAGIGSYPEARRERLRSAGVAPREARAASSCPLSERELEVLRLMAIEGLQGEGIAHRLGLSASTVRQHCMKAYRKLGVTHAVQALVVCFNAGWIDPVQTRIQDPTRYDDDRVTDSQRAYLAAFDRHLAAGDDQRELRLAKRRTDVALLDLERAPRSYPARDWMDRLVTAIARTP